ncbi:MAG: DUF3795 domain-containing protein [Methanomassiliicoccales archaeon]
MLREASLPIGICGLNCNSCVYRWMEGVNESGCPGCWERGSCDIRDCCESSQQDTCEECSSFPCYHLWQGYQSMREHYIY